MFFSRFGAHCKQDACGPVHELQIVNIVPEKNRTKSIVHKSGELQKVNTLRPESDRLLTRILHEGGTKTRLTIWVFIILQSIIRVL